MIGTSVYSQGEPVTVHVVVWCGVCRLRHPVVEEAIGGCVTRCREGTEHAHVFIARGAGMPDATGCACGVTYGELPESQR